MAPRKRAARTSLKKSATPAKDDAWFYHSQLLTVLIVSIAAIIVMIGLFWIQNSGAVVYSHGANTMEEQDWVNLGVQIASQYTLDPYTDRIEDCSRECGNQCAARQRVQIGECYDWCKSTCEGESSYYTALSTEAAKVHQFGPQYS